jgi:hypothetical protein
VPISIDVAPLLRAAFSDAHAWSAQLPAGGESLVTLRAIHGPDVLAHPLGSLQVRQRVVPLGRTLERFGANVPSGTRLFRITGATIDRSPSAAKALEDLFAPGEFRALTDEQKLTSPSFEAMTSGATLGTPAVAHGAGVAVAVVYEQRVITAAGVTLPPEPANLPDDVFFELTVARAPVRVGLFAMQGIS